MQREIEVIFKCSIHSSIDESSSEKLFFQKVLQKIDFFKGTGFPCTAPEIRVGKCLHATLNVTTYIGPLVDPRELIEIYNRMTILSYQSMDDFAS